MLVQEKCMMSANASSEIGYIFKAEAELFGGGCTDKVMKNDGTPFSCHSNILPIVYYRLSQPLCNLITSCDFINGFLVFLRLSLSNVYLISLCFK